MFNLPPQATTKIADYNFATTLCLIEHTLKQFCWKRAVKSTSFRTQALHLRCSEFPLDSSAIHFVNRSDSHVAEVHTHYGT